MFIVDQELVKYIKDNYAKGFSLEQIVDALRSVGWREADINQAVDAAIPYYTPVSTQNVKPSQVEQVQAAYEPQETVTQSSRSTHHVALFVFLGLFVVIGVVVVMNTLNVSLPSAYQDVLTKANEVRSEIASPEIPTPTIPSEENVPAEQSPQQNAVEYPSPEVIQKEPASCSSLSCFKNTVSTCGPSSVRDTIIKDGMGTKERVTSFYELRGFEDTKCKFYVRTESIDISYTDSYKVQLAKQGDTIQQIDAKEAQENSEADKKEGLDGLCLIQPVNITQMLDRWQHGMVRTTDMTKKFCTGGLFP